MQIIAENISKAFGEKKVLDSFTHIFSDGKTTAVMGASGCGKTTLLRILMGLLEPDSGRVVLPEGARISAVFQEDRLCENLTVSANIRLAAGKRYPRETLEQALSQVGLFGCADTPVRELSGGMKRRTALLRALLCEYDVLFMDEPFKGLDEETKRTVMEWCKEKTRGRTVVVVTHDSAEAQFMADEIINL